MKQSHIREKLINYLHSHNGYDTLETNIQKLKDAFPVPTSIKTIFTIYDDGTVNTTIIVNKATKPTTTTTFQCDQKPIPSFLTNPPLYHVSQTVKGYKNIPKSLKDLGKAIDRLDKQKILVQLSKRR
jgi:hypothetical protein